MPPAPNLFACIQLRRPCSGGLSKISVGQKETLTNSILNTAHNTAAMLMAIKTQKSTVSCAHFCVPCSRTKLAGSQRV